MPLEVLTKPSKRRSSSNIVPTQRLHDDAGRFGLTTDAELRDLTNSYEAANAAAYGAAIHKRHAAA